MPKTYAPPSAAGTGTTYTQNSASITGVQTAVASTISSVPANTESATDLKASAAMGFAIAFEEFTQPSWDGEAAEPVSGDTIKRTERLLQNLSSYIPAPEAAPASNGSICLEWNSLPDKVWLDVEPDGTVAVLVKVGPTLEERSFRFDEQNLATYLQAALASLYPVSRQPAVRSLLVPA